MKNYSGKIAFAGVMVIIALVSRAAYPRLYSIATGNGFKADATSSAARPPQFILPALSLVTDPERIAASSAPAYPNSVSAVSGGPIGVLGANGVSVAPLGGIPNSGFLRIGDAAPPAIAARAAIVADLLTGTHILAENATERRPLASVTKLMTATVALDKLSPAQKITITNDAFNADPSEKTLRVGDTYSVADLLRFLLMPSSNVAAEALADAYGRDRFIAEMNARAAAWGMVSTSTYYVDPSGIAVGNQSTASDLVPLAQKIYSGYPQILAITRTPQVVVTNGLGGQVIVKSINQFAGQTDFIGGKTGYTDQADGNLLSIFSYGGRPVIIVILGTPSGVRFADTEALYNWFAANFKS